MKATRMLLLGMLVASVWMSASTRATDKPPVQPVTAPVPVFVVQASEAPVPVPAAPVSGDGKTPILLRLRMVEWEYTQQTPGVRQLLERMDVSQSKVARRQAVNALSLPDPAAADDFLNQLRQQGKLRVLSEPTIMTLSGQVAHMHCGGEVALPAAGGSAAEPPGKMKIGTELYALPVLKPDGTLQLAVDLTQRDLDAARSVTVGGQSVPAIRSRSVSTTVAMKPGQTLVLAGPREGHTSAAAEAPSSKVLLLLIFAEVGDNVARALNQPVAR